MQADIDALIEGKKNQVSYIDALLDELYGTINSELHADEITNEQALYLREKYLGLGDPNENRFY